MVLRLRQPAPNWDLSKCKGFGTAPWFDEDSGPAIEFCNGDADGVICPLREACLGFALLNNERFGVWGGTSEQDRRLTRKIYPWPGGSEPHPEWRWRSHDDLVIEYHASFSQPPPTEIEDDDDDEDETYD